MANIYSVKEIFYSLQGEGMQTGRAAIFLRFAGCNLWNGLEPHRRAAICQFCDTDFIGTNGTGGGKFDSPKNLAKAAKALWPEQGKPYVICTGGEPSLQLDAPLIAALKAEGFEIAIETNGTNALLEGIDWVCVSPKGRAPLQQKQGDELKLVYPQIEIEAQPERFTALNFSHFLLQPLAVMNDVKASQKNVQATTDYCLKNPQWRLSLQTHKIVGLP